MEFSGRAGEIQEVPGKIKESGDFKQTSLDKFDRLFGDDKLDVTDTKKDIASKQEASEQEREAKFDRLFGDDKPGQPEDKGDSGEKEKQPETEGDPGEKKELTDEEKQQKIRDFLDGKVDFEEVKEIFAEFYAAQVNGNRPWSWGENIPGGENLTAAQRKEVRDYAREKGMVPTVPTYIRDGKVYADFSAFMKFECVLEREDWKKTDREQFDKCNEMLKNAIKNNPDLAKQFTKEQLEQIEKGETPSGYTWHHSEKDGVMQLVPYGIHNSTSHHGGRSEGNWADSSRQ